MPYLSSVLNFSGATDLPAGGLHIHATDTLTSSPGSLILAHFAQSALLPRPARSHSGAIERRWVMWVGCDAQGQPHMHSVLHKAGLPVSSLLQPSTSQQDQQPRLTYVDALDTILSAADRGTSARDTLQRLFVQLEHALPPQQLEPTSRDADPSAVGVVIVDDLSALAWSLGTNESEQPDVPQEVNLWIAALRHLCQANDAALVTLQHASNTSLGADAMGIAVHRAEEYLLRQIITSHADLWIQVRHLTSGRAPDVSGELVVHRLARPTAALMSTSSYSGLDLDRFTVHLTPGAERGLLFRVRAGGATSRPIASTPTIPEAWAETGLGSREMASLRDAHASVAAASRAAAFWTPGQAPS